MKSVVQRTARGNNHGDTNNNHNQNGPPTVRVRRKINPASPPTAVEVCGITVHFPFRPYKCQEEYMTQVIKALSRSENALLESPTGTGKTLCLLCSTLAWQRSQAQLLLQTSNNNNSDTWQQPSSQASMGLGSEPPSSATNSTTRSSNNSQTNANNNNSNRKSSHNLPTIIYASRTHSQLSQVVRELRNTRYRPAHAVLGSREHMCVHPKVKKPHSSASDINHDCGKLCKERKCRFRNALEGFIPPSNEVIEATDAGSGSLQSQQQQHQPVMDMEEMIQMGKAMNVCPFYYTRGLVEHAELILVPYNYLFDKDARETTLQDVPWENAIVIFDEAHNLESFASDSASFDLSNTDLAGCVLEVDRALNYLAVTAGGDQQMAHNLKSDNLLRLKALFLKLEDYILNQIPSHKTAFGGEYMMHLLQEAAGITHANHEILMDEIRKVNDVILDLKGTGATRGSPRLEHFCTCLKRVYGHGSLEAKCLAKASFYRVYVSPKQTAHPARGGGGPNSNKTTYGGGNSNSVVSRTVSYWCFAPALAMEELANLNVRSILVTSGTLSPLPSYSMELGLPFPHTLENPHIIDAKQQLHVRVIGKGVTGKVLTSSYERRKDDEYYTELGMTLAELAKVVPAGLLVFFPSYGVMDSCLEKWGGPSSGSGFSSNNKKNDFFAPQQQRRKKKVSSSSDTNQFVFPQIPASYFNAASKSTIMSICWKKLLAVKSVVLEPRSSADLNEAISEYQRLLALPGSPGCILMGVCRGKISEGIDFAGDMSRAVVITGIPFAPAMDPKVKLKREYLDGAVRAAALAKQQQASGCGGFGKQEEELKKLPTSFSTAVKLSGNEWYTQQAHRAVNQAVGRVIRSRTDYGAVLLLDSRFDQERNQLGLSKWIRPHVRKDQGFSVATKELGQFYKTIQDKCFELVACAPPPPPCPPLFDHDEENTENCARVAIIRQDDCKPAAQISAGGSGSYIPPNQVIAKIDVKSFAEQRQEQQSSALKTANDVKSAASSERISSSNYDSVFQPSKKAPPTTRVKTASERDAAATHFMEGTQSLPITEQSKVRKSIVVMKKASDDRDVRAYRQSAQQVLEIIIRKGGDDNTQKPQESMLFIFFQLLPPAYKQETESMARKMVFDLSALNDLAKLSLAPADYNRLKSCMLGLIQKLWQSESSNQTSAHSILRDIQEVISIVCLKSTNKSQSKPMCSALVRMIPNRFKEQTQTMVDDMVAQQNIELLKQRDRARVGAAGMDMRRFALPKRSSSLPAPATSSAQAGETTTTAPGITKTQAPASVVASVKGGKQPLSTNPYLRRSSLQPPTSSSLVPMKNPYLRPRENPHASSFSSSADASLTISEHDDPGRKRPRLEQQQPPQLQQKQPDNAAKRPPVVANSAPKRTTAPPVVVPRTNPYKTTKKTTITAAVVAATATVKTSSQPVSGRSSLDSLLNAVESDVFVRSKDKHNGSTTLSTRPDSNAPKDLTCPFCEQSLPQPFMAPCGHVGCWSCWEQWIHKSATCPICRAACSCSDLVQAVFDVNSKANSSSTSLNK
ncbi:hypothetical protein ACA910_004338 [Epithemia clementina (nom. ined.)]